MPCPLPARPGSVHSLSCPLNLAELGRAPLQPFVDVDKSPATWTGGFALGNQCLARCPRVRVRFTPFPAGSISLAPPKLTIPNRTRQTLGLPTTSVHKIIWKALRRKKLQSAPFSPEWRKIIEMRCLFYFQLPEHDRNEIEGHIQIFLAEKEFEGCDGLSLTDEIKVCVAAFACLLLLHRAIGRAS